VVAAPVEGRGNAGYEMIWRELGSRSIEELVDLLR